MTDEFREKIVRFVASGHTIRQAMDKFDISMTTAYKACKQSGIDFSGGLSWTDRRERRKKIAEFIASGRTYREATFEFAVSQMTVSNACAEHGVSPDTRVKNATLEIIADLLNTDLNYKQIGAKRGVTGVAVGLVANRCAKAGIIILRRIGRIYSRRQPKAKRN